MKKKITLLLIIIVLAAPLLLAAEESEIISPYEGSEVVFDDKIGFNQHHILAGDTEVRVVEGKIRRRFCEAPEGRSPYEILKNYEKAIQGRGGEIIHLTRTATTDYRKNNRFIRNIFTKERIGRLNHYPYMKFPHSANEYLAGKISTAEADIYIALASAIVDDVTYFTLVTVEAEPMEMGMVDLEVLNDGMAAKGKVAIYDIYFDSGKSDLKDESAPALEVIAGYLKANPGKKFLVVGHTDNVGDFESNIVLSGERAAAVINELVAEYGVNSKQLKPHGVGPTSPVMSNSDSTGRARNRRVELVEQ
ncbi:MAG: OmpA family protein [bacterium]